MPNPSDLVFSIVIPVFNHGIFLEDCIRSLQNQSFSNWEALIIDDGSVDETANIGLRITSYDTRFSYVYQNNQGLSAARNSGMKLAKGHFLFFLDADDWFESNCLDRLNVSITNFPHFDLYRVGYAYWNRFGGRCLHRHSPTIESQVYPSVLTQNLGPCHSILIRKSFADQIGGFDPMLNSCEDWDFWIRAGKLGARIHSIPDVLVAYRYVPDSMSRNPKVMYEALTEVSRRAGQIDPRLPESAPFNRSADLDYPEIQKNHLITVLGVMLHQSKVAEALDWYRAEQQKWNWNVLLSDWKRLSSYLSWGYFFEANEIEELLSTIQPRILLFFLSLGYSSHEAKSLTRMVFAPQLKKRNHLRYGKLLGGLWNKIGWH